MTRTASRARAPNARRLALIGSLFNRHSLRNDPALVLIDPALAGGRPVIAGTGLATRIIAERYKLGESIGDLADDYERPGTKIEEAIRCELEAAA